MNFSKSVNLFGAVVFFRNFSRPMLAMRIAKSQNEVATRALGGNRAWVMTPKIRNSDQQIDILLELRIDHQAQVACRDGTSRARFWSKQYYSYTGKSTQVLGRSEKIRCDDTFRFITLVLSDGFGRGFVNAVLKHQGTIWFEPWCPENLLRTESCRTKFRVRDDFRPISGKCKCSKI